MYILVSGFESIFKSHKDVRASDSCVCIRHAFSFIEISGQADIGFEPIRRCLVCVCLFISLCHHIPSSICVLHNRWQKYNGHKYLDLIAPLLAKSALIYQRRIELLTDRFYSQVLNVGA